MIMCQNCYIKFSLFILDELQYWRMETNQEISSAGGLDAIDEFSLLLDLLNPSCTGILCYMWYVNCISAWYNIQPVSLETPHLFLYLFLFLEHPILQGLYRWYIYPTLSFL